MNSSPLLEAPAPAAANSLIPSFPAAPEGEASVQPFGEVLEQVTAQTQTTTEETESQTETETETETDFPFEIVECEIVEEDEKKDEIDFTAILPLICFCPPPEIRPLPETAIQVEGVIEEPVAEVETQAPAPVQNSLPETQTKPILERLVPSKLERHETRPLKETSEPRKAQKAKSDGKLQLDPELFETVADVPVEVPETIILSAIRNSEVSGQQGSPLAFRAPEPEAPSRAGTPAAQQGNAMKNGQKTAENAPAIEQKMPVREGFRRILPENARIENPGLISQAHSHRISIEQVDSPVEVIPLQSVENVHIVESIRTEVTQLRQRGESSMTVVLKPDSGTELQIEISVRRDGSIQAQARFERGDFQTLNAQWPHLQQTLATHGIRMTDLSNPGNSHHHQPQNDPSNLQNFDRGHNSQQRNPQQARAFDEELAASTPRLPAQKTFPQPAAAPSRRWQSWA